MPQRPESLAAQVLTRVSNDVAAAIAILCELTGVPFEMAAIVELIDEVQPPECEDAL